MSKPYLDLIDDRITDHEREIARLTIAREVIAEIGPLPQPRQQQPRLAAPKTKARRQGRSTVRRTILDTLANGPVFSRDISMPDTPRNHIWNTLHAMRKQGLVVKLDDGSYALPDNTEGKPDAAE